MQARAFLAVFILTPCLQAVAQDSLPTDPQSGLIVDADWQLVLANCSGCHSTRLVTQNRMSAADWTQTIRWMQDKHNLWDLGESELKIVAYLEKHYGVPNVPHRRRPLDQPPIEEKEHSP